MVRYKVKPDQAARNEELVRAVYEELEQTRPDGLSYATFKLDDGVSFMHLAAIDGVLAVHRKVTRYSRRR